MIMLVNAKNLILSKNAQSALREHAGHKQNSDSTIQTAQRRTRSFVAWPKPCTLDSAGFPGSLYSEKCLEKFLGLY